MGATTQMDMHLEDLWGTLPESGQWRKLLAEAGLAIEEAAR